MFDFESSSFRDHLFEYEKTFPPRFELMNIVLSLNSFFPMGFLVILIVKNIMKLVLTFVLVVQHGVIEFFSVIHLKMSSILK